MDKAEITKARKSETTKKNSGFVFSSFRVFVILFSAKACKR